MYSVKPNVHKVLCPVEQRKNGCLFWYTISYKKMEKSDYVTTSDYGRLWARIRVTKRGYWWLWVTTSDGGPEYERLQVTMRNYNIWLPYLWPYLTSECHSKYRYSALNLDKNWWCFESLKWWCFVWRCFENLLKLGVNC